MISYGHGLEERLNVVKSPFILVTVTSVRDKTTDAMNVNRKS